MFRDGDPFFQKCRSSQQVTAETSQRRILIDPIRVIPESSTVAREPKEKQHGLAVKSMYSGGIL